MSDPRRRRDRRCAHPLRARAGHSLAEALCALALAGLLAAASGLALLAARRGLEGAEDRARGGRAEREAVFIVRQALASGGAVLARGDTAVELDLLLGAGVACDVGPRELWLAAPRDAGLTAMPQLPTPDDLVAVRGWTPETADWWYGTLDSVQMRASAVRCPEAEGWRESDAAGAPGALIRLVLSDTLPAALDRGSDVRLYRRGRFALYHAGRGEWSLGWRRCHPFTEACGPIQPVAGPLQTPGAGGFRIQAVGTPARWQISARGVGGRGAATELPW